MQALEQLNLFLSIYNKSKDLNFSKVDIFSNTKIIQPFGIFLKENDLIFSSSTCFGRARTFYYDVFAPFNFERVEYLEDLNLIVLHSDFGFSMRIYNVLFETITPDFWNSLDNNKSLNRGSKICKSGKIKYLSPFEAKLEIYSESPSVLSSILSLKYSVNYLLPYHTEMILDFLNIYGLDHEKGIQTLEEIKIKESIVLMNSFICIKKDKILNKNLTFFSYNALFN